MKNLQNILAWKFAPLGLKYSCGETYESLVVAPDSLLPKPTEQELTEAAYEYSLYKAETNYQIKRQGEYPSVVDQLDLLYHGGYEGWRAAIEAVKMKYPKPQ